MEKIQQNGNVKILRKLLTLFLCCDEVASHPVVVSSFSLLLDNDYLLSRSCIIPAAENVLTLSEHRQNSTAVFICRNKSDLLR